MKGFRFIWIGIIFGIILTKSEVISWYRIQEMFRFQDFHMYGVIGSAVILGAVIIRIIKARQVKSILGEPIGIDPKPKNYTSALVGGSIFGLGWALTGACPGPIYILIGNGFLPYLVVLFFAVIGAFTYGLIRNRLPH
ncbi:MAG: YeeE/YedE family protein [Saprospiraceae bacterium]|nr:YeeE/YedE family protein [Saprospiraceae bacterium]